MMPTFGESWKPSDLSKLTQLQPKPTVDQMFQSFPPQGEQPYQWMPPPIPAPEGQQPQSPPQTVTLLIPPRPAERPRFSKFGGAYNSKAYSEYKKKLVELLKAKILLGAILLPADYASIMVDFYLPVPKSWTKRRKAAAYGTLHRSKPDADNYLKAICDAMTEAAVFKDDGQVAVMVARKWYVHENAEPRLEFELHTLDAILTH